MPQTQIPHPTFKATVASPLGPILLLLDETHLYYAGFVDPSCPDPRVAHQAMLPEAPADHPLAQQATQGLQDYFTNSTPLPTLPLAPQGTAFQQQVWQALQDIPSGATWSYQHLAEHSGRPKAVRAVGAACGANPISLWIPCHRAVAKSGRLHGYYWGLERKRALLGLELERTTLTQLAA